MSRSTLQAEEVAMYRENDLNSTEERLRRRIRKAITGEQQPLPATTMRSIEDRVLALMREYVRSPVEHREQVYEEYEAELLRAINTARRINHTQRSSSTSEG